MKISSGIVGVLLALAITSSATGTAGATGHLPPFTQPVVDTANIVAGETERQVGAELTDYQARSGNQIAVAVIETTAGRSIEDYSIDLARSWGVGQKDKDSGILLVIATGDRKVRIEVGRGLEAKLTDLQSGRIIRERLVPLLAKGDVAAAVVQGTQAIRVDLGDTQVGALPAPLVARERSSGSSLPWLPIVALLGFAVVVIIGRRLRGGRGPGRGQDGESDAVVWGAALLALSGFGGHGGFGGGGGGFGGGGGGGFGGGGASGDW